MEIQGIASNAVNGANALLSGKGMNGALVAKAAAGSGALGGNMSPGAAGAAANGAVQQSIADARSGFQQVLSGLERREAAEAVDANTTAANGAAGGRIDRESKLYEQCQALETFLVKNLLSGMRKNVLKSSLIDTGYAGEIYEDMLWDKYAEEYTKNAGFGLADTAYLELTGQRGQKIAVE